MTTQVQVQKIGENFVLPLSQEIVDRLGIQNGSQVEISTSENSIVFHFLQLDERKQEFQKLKGEIFDKYEDVFEALAEGAR